MVGATYLGAWSRVFVSFLVFGTFAGCQATRGAAENSHRNAGSPTPRLVDSGVCSTLLGGSSSDASTEPNDAADSGDAQAPPPLYDGGRDSLDGSADPAANRQTAKHAILISVDGLGAGYVAQLLSQRRLPNIAALAVWGASTLRARPDYDYTETLPDHTSMITGRPVAAVPGLPNDVYHGYVKNGMPGPDETLHNSGNPNLAYVASVFDVAHDAGLKTCLYSGKPKFVLFAQSYSATAGAPDVTGADNGQNKIDRCSIVEQNTAALVAMAAADMAAGLCDFVFFHVADTDFLGHSVGWGSPEWLNFLDTVDAWVGTLAKFTALTQPEPWALVLTADHGGSGYSHIDPTVLDDYRIPFFVVGPNVKADTDLYEFVGKNRRDPGLERPDYTAAPQPIRNGDAANTILRMLGLPSVPGSLMKDLLP